MELTNEWESNMSKFGLKAMPESVLLTSPKRMKAFNVRRDRREFINAILMLLIFTGAFVTGIFQLYSVLQEGSPLSGFSYFQSMNTEYVVGQIIIFAIFLIIWLASMYLLIAAIRWRIDVDGDMLTIRKPLGRKILIHVSEISGVDIKRNSYVLMRGTKALAKSKLSDENIGSLMEKLGVRR
jgi:hypothetical protein